MRTCRTKYNICHVDYEKACFFLDIERGCLLRGAGYKTSPRFCRLDLAPFPSCLQYRTTKREWAKSDFSHAVLLINLLYVESRPSRIVVLVPLRRGSDGAVWYLTILHSKWLEAHAEHGYQRKRKIDRK